MSHVLYAYHRLAESDRSGKPLAPNHSDSQQDVISQDDKLISRLLTKVVQIRIKQTYMNKTDFKKYV